MDGWIEGWTNQVTKVLCIARIRAIRGGEAGCLFVVPATAPVSYTAVEVPRFIKCRLPE